ncbi:MAG: alpha/beta hydrolase [Phycisphaerales bacterium]|nr:alpha/beta hydrolase [Phycisphaerales bacterium]MCB9854783.1 alpha/beta hydrolase [Phycisphaerales bacterium]
MSFAFLNPAGCIQERILFPTHVLPPPAARPQIHETVEWTRERTLGGHGVAWYIPTPEASRENRRPCVVFFHGNAEIIDHQTDLVLAYREMGCSTLLVEYPGYGRSQGFPGQQSILDDADFFYEKLVEQPDVDATCIVFHGRSVGGAVAAQLANRHEPAALILQSTFTSVPDIAKQFLLPAFLVRHPFHTDKVLPNLECPILIFHGTQDRIVPVSHGHKLRDLAAKSRLIRYVEFDCDHNDFPGAANNGDDWLNIERLLEDVGVLNNNPARAKGIR